MAGYPLWVSTLAAKPARLTTNRHGTFSLRWIVPVRLRDEHGRPREVRISLRTRDCLTARILALEFNLALERNKAMTLPFDPSTIAPWSLQAGGVKIEVTCAENQKLFQQAMKDDPDLRAALLEAMRSGMQPAEAHHRGPVVTSQRGRRRRRRGGAAEVALGGDQRVRRQARGAGATATSRWACHRPRNCLRSWA